MGENTKGRPYPGLNRAGDVPTVCPQDREPPALHLVAAH